MNTALGIKDIGYVLLFSLTPAVAMGLINTKIGSIGFPGQSKKAFFWNGFLLAFLGTFVAVIVSFFTVIARNENSNLPLGLFLIPPIIMIFPLLPTIFFSRVSWGKRFEYALLFGFLNAVALFGFYLFLGFFIAPVLNYLNL